MRRKQQNNPQMRRIGKSIWNIRNKNLDLIKVKINIPFHK